MTPQKPKFSSENYLIGRLSAVTRKFRVLQDMFKYPGGKTKLLPILEPYLKTLVTGQQVFHDLFVGGGSILLHMARNYPQLELHANDVDADVANFWALVSENPLGVEELCARLPVEPTRELFFEFKNLRPRTAIERALKFVFLNRTSYNGMRLHPYGGKMQEKNKIGDRYNPESLGNSIITAHKLLHGRCHVHQEDGISYLKRIKNEPLYLDPPYFRAGKSLYHFWMQPAQHAALAEVLKSREQWVLSYDNAQPIWVLYPWADITIFPVRYCINGKKAQWKTKSELVIGPGISPVDADHALASVCDIFGGVDCAPLNTIEDYYGQGSDPERSSSSPRAYLQTCPYSPDTSR